MPTLKEISEFIDTQKNLGITLLAIFIGLYVTMNSSILDMTIAKQWVDLAQLAVGIYIGHRIEAGRTPKEE